MFPLYMNDVFGYATAMALATVLGVGFGFVLERSGFGRGSILVSQFYGTDNRVLKVMFSAIATTTAGLGLLGFVISGYCPGTALVAAGSGNTDGVFSIFGTMLGGVLFALFFPAIEPFYLSGAMGSITLPELLGVSWPVVAAGVVAMAVVAFLVVERAEVYFSKRAGLPVPAGTRTDRNAAFAAMGGIAAFGLLTLAMPPTVDAAVADVRPEPIGAVELAERLVAAPTSVWIVDLRDPAVCAADRVPGALCLPEDDPDAELLATLPPTRELVLYGQQTLTAAPPAAARFPGRVLVLDGGYAGFDQAVLTEPTPPTDPTREAAAAYAHLAAIHGQLTGSSAPVAPVAVKPTAVKRSTKKGGGC
jgi:hypothetical protein